MILSISEGQYYGLNEVAALIWKLIDTPRSMQDIVAAITSEFDVTEREASNDAIELVDVLAAEGLAYVDSMPRR